MFLIGPTAGILPYLLVVLVSLMYYIEGGKNRSAEVIQQTTLVQSVESNINAFKTVAEAPTTEKTAPVIPCFIPVSLGYEISPHKLPVSLKFKNGPRRAPPAILA